MNRKLNKLKIIPLEERIVLDAALGSALAHSSPPSHSSSNIIYVDAHAKPGGDGSSWAHAYNSLQDALTAAAKLSTPEQIWIAQGNYTPSQVYSPNGVTGGASGLNQAQLQTFNLPNNVTLIGGFVSGATSISQSNPLLHPTILNGDLGNGQDVWHVVTLGNDVNQTGVTATLENLTIENGLANGPDAMAADGSLIYSHESGGGIYERFGSNLTLNDVSLINDKAALSSDPGIPTPTTASGLIQGGGGISVLDSSLTVNNSTFSKDIAGISSSPNGNGGAIFGYDASIAINNSTFSHNSAVDDGGAVAVEASNPLVINNSVFDSNSVTSPNAPNMGSGGAVQVYNTELDLSNSVLSNNSATFSAGAVLIVDALDAFSVPHTASLQNDTFIGNSSGYEAGAITVTSQAYANPGSIVTINNSEFVNNYSGGIAGAIDDDSINLNVNNSTFVGNVAAGSAGAINSDGFFYTLVGGVPLTSVNLNSDVFSGNIAEGSQAANDKWTNLFTGPTFGAFVAPGGGAVESIWNSQVNISNSVFTGNLALNGDGGAIKNGGGHMYLGDPSFITASASSMNLSNDTIIGNIALKGNGGGVANERDVQDILPSAVDSQLSISKSTFSLDSANQDGGAVYSDNSSLNAHGNTMLLNTAHQGSEIAALNSTVNGESSSSPSAAHDLALANSFYLLFNGDLFLS